MAVRVARQHRVERRHPGVETGAELASERVVAPESGRRDLGEDRAPARLVRCDDAPSIRRPATRRAAAPAHSPDADVLDAPRLRRRPDDVVADVGADERPTVLTRIRLDRVTRNSATVTSRSPSTSRRSSAPNARASSERPGRQRRRSSHLERTVAGRRRLVGREQAAAAKVRREEPFADARRSTRDSARSASPSSREPRFQLVRLPLRGKRVAARFEVLQKRLERLGDRELRPVDAGACCSLRRSTRARRPRRDCDAAPTGSAVTTGATRGA